MTILFSRFPRVLRRDTVLIALLISLVSIFSFYILFTNASLAHADSPVVLSAGSVSTTPGGSVDIPISIDPTGSTLKPTSIQWNFAYNPSQILNIFWKSDGQAAISANKSGSCTSVSSGLIRCVVLGLNTTQIGAGQLGTVTVITANPLPVSSIPLQFSNVIAADATATSVPVTAINSTITINQNSGQGIGGPLTVICTPSSLSPYAGNNMTWNATVSGGTGTYTYVWSGTDNLNGSGSSANISYINEGTKTATVQVTSGTQTVTAQCTGPVNVTFAPITGVCGISVSPTFNSQYSLNWTTFAQSQSNQPLAYNWTGTDGLAGTNSNIYKNYTTPGLKTGTVTISGGSQSFSLTCSANLPTIVPTPTPALNGSCAPTINGMTVNWNAYGSGGNGSPFTYSWSGLDGLTSTTSANSFLPQTYTTEGTKTATVLIQSGNDSLTLTCQARIASTTPSNGHCFIATAAYGTPMEPEVEVLRHFRDEALLTNKVGTVMTDVYYAVSPPIAEFIRPHESLKAIVRLGLEPIIYGLEKMGYTQ